MQNQFFQSLLCRTPLRRSRSVIASISLSLSVVLGGLTTALVAEASPDVSQAARPQAATDASPAPASLSNGVYLFGQSAKPEEIGNAYLVFEVRDSKMIGAFYMPRSSFDCVYGSLQPNQLALTVVNSYDQSTHPYEIAVRQDNPVTTAGSNSAVKKFGLEGMQQLTEVSENDQRILEVCKANFPQALN
jgi:hypothetical protein